jgi:hypothetical protein
MAAGVLTLGVRTEQDAVLTGRRARDLAALLQLSARAQINLSVAAWELASLAAPRGNVEFALIESNSSPAISIMVAGVSRVRVDLDRLRHLVDRVATRNVDRRAVVELVAGVRTDAWIPSMDELELVLASLTRYEQWHRAGDR